MEIVGVVHCIIKREIYMRCGLCIQGPPACARLPSPHPVEVANIYLGPRSHSYAVSSADGMSPPLPDYPSKAQGRYAHESPARLTMSHFTSVRPRMWRGTSNNTCTSPTAHSRRSLLRISCQFPDGPDTSSQSF